VRIVRVANFVTDFIEAHHAGGVEMGLRKKIRSA